MSDTLPLLGEAGPEAVIPLRGGRMFIAPVGTDADDRAQWVEVGTGRGFELYTWGPVHDAPWPTIPPLTTRSTSIAFDLSDESWAGFVALMEALRLATIRRRRARSVTRRKYRARARRRT